MNKFFFSGHETFICKQFWLKKGYDYLTAGLQFSDKNAVVNLGVGKNMVTSIQFWMKAFGLLEEDGRTPNNLAHQLFSSEDGYDPYLENIGTIWLLHYKLVSAERSSLYHILFNDFRKERQEFTRENLFQYVKRKCEENLFEVNKNTLETDIGVFVKGYVKPDDSEKIEIEESFTGLLLDLDLVKREWRENMDGKKVEHLTIASEARLDLPYQIVLYVILDLLDDLQKGSSITFRQLQTDPNAPGMIFALNNDSLYEKIKQITNHYKDQGVSFSDTAGVQTLQFNTLFSSSLTKDQVLNDYYQA